MDVLRTFVLQLYDFTDLSTPQYTLLHRLIRVPDLATDGLN